MQRERLDRQINEYAFEPLFKWASAVSNSDSNAVLQMGPICDIVIHLQLMQMATSELCEETVCCVVFKMPERPPCFSEASQSMVTEC